jgi:hypothetical protein
MLLYHIARMGEPDSDGHRFEFHSQDRECDEEEFDGLLDWARGEFGEGGPARNLGDQADSRWCYEPRTWTVWFRDEVDAMHFRLRWC